MSPPGAEPDGLRQGGEILARQLVIHGTDRVFCVPGESYLPLLDALRDTEIQVITCRHEAGAANMAEASGKLTRRPGVCIVSRAPGATNGSIGIHTAMQDSTPMVMIVGQAVSAVLGREAFQEVEYRVMFAPLAKWVAQIDRADRIPELVARAFATACAGRPGPVVLAVPEDILDAHAVVDDASPFQTVTPGVDPGEVKELADLLAQAKRPLAIVGGARWTPAAARGLQTFLESNLIPAGTAFRRQDALDNDSPVYAGDIGIGINPRLARRVRDADLVLAIGPRLGEATTSRYTLLEPPRPRQRLVHVLTSAEELGRVYQADLPILAAPEPFATAVEDLRVDPRWRTWCGEARTDYEAWQEVKPMPGDLNLAECVKYMRTRVPDAMVANGAGNHSAWIHRYWRFREFPTQLAPTSGAMGYGLPAAVGAKAVNPGRAVICFSGDGDFLMLGQELATAVQYSLPVIVIVVDNGMYGAIRLHQERAFPGRVVATDLQNPDFAGYARSFGAHAETVARTEDFPAAFERAIASETPAVLWLPIHRDTATPGTRLSEVREAAERT